MLLKNIKINTTYEKKFIVEKAMLASVVKSGEVTALATPMLVMMIENTAMLCLIDALDSFETSVGSAINISHDAPSFLNNVIHVYVVVQSVQKRTVVFDVSAYDNGIQITKGTHTRVIVDKVKFESKALQR